ncbi:MAG: hypothetical protein ACM3VS_07355 [Candidatus Dadabacteria bacterium]
MKTPDQLLSKDPYAEQHAKTAIDKIQKWVEVRYPTLASVAKSRMIIECLIEIVEERKYIAAQ